MDSSRFTRYLALGDSMSIDLYPALDAGEVDVAVALERVAFAGRVAPLGAASLLYQNAEERWPEHMGDDLASLLPGISYMNVAADGATIGDVFGEQLDAVEASDEPVLVTLTVGSTDLWSVAAAKTRRAVLAQIGKDVVGAYNLLLDALRERLPAATIVLTTICDPSDRSGRVAGMRDGAPLPLELLDVVNAHLRSLASRSPSVLVADAYAHFLGHGVSDAEGERWYWRRSPAELNARGASELRDLWLATARGAGGRLYSG
ncbi:MAG: SGNH/GDSL hydrolase family protein [Gemmatimonadales bacterium]